MEPVLYIIAILGCGEGTEPCERRQVAEARYESRAECMAATDAALTRHGGDLDFPVIVAQCRAENEPVRVVMPSEVLLPEPEAEARRTALAAR